MFQPTSILYHHLVLFLYLHRDTVNQPVICPFHRHLDLQFRLRIKAKVDFLHNQQNSLFISYTRQKRLIKTYSSTFNYKTFGEKVQFRLKAMF